ncbi:MAG: hypothetical protein IT464_10975 [Planctomycetes bacterium]|nr:hypothetical protein [Planctomycetota bacterium]
MTGYKVLTKQGLKGPFKKSSIYKAVTSAMLPLQARLLEIDSGRYISAAELVGERVEPKAKPEPLHKVDDDTRPHGPGETTKAEPLKFADEAPQPEPQRPQAGETLPKVIFVGKVPLKRAIRLPKSLKARPKLPAAEQAPVGEESDELILTN